MSLKLDLLLTRDSVNMSDDINAPNEKGISISENATLEELTKTIIINKYLPSIQNGKASWVLNFGNKPIAIIAEEWKEAKFLVDKDKFIYEFTKPEPKVGFYLNYLAQKDPTEIFDTLIKKLK
jgi:hypothetical protein